MGDASVLSLCSLLRIPWPVATGEFEHCRKVEASCWFSIFRGVSFKWHLQDDEGCHCSFLYSQLYSNFSSAANSINYVGQFLGIVEAVTYFSFMTVMSAV